MKTFTATLPAVGFWSAVFVPPVLFFALVQIVASGLDGGRYGIGSFLFLMALAQVLPVTALISICFSTAAYSVTPEKLIVHRVVYDRDVSYAEITNPPQLKRGVITLRGRKRLRLRVDQPESCLAVLEGALSQYRLNPGQATHQ